MDFGLKHVQSLSGLKPIRMCSQSVQLTGPHMKYHSRTITWHFRDSIELIPELANVTKLTIRSPEDLVKNYGSLFEDRVRERFIVFWLNSANRVTGFEIVSE